MIGIDTTAIRLMKYKDTLKKLKSLGLVKVFSDNLADSIGVSPSLVRKDFSFFNISGYKRGGYYIDELLEKLNVVLGRNTLHKLVIAGAGKLGLALCNYKGFQDEYIKILALFDIDEEKINPESPIPILPAESLRAFVTEHRVSLGIIAVPEDAAQRTADNMILGGIKGILNFTPLQIRVPKKCIVNTVNLELELDNLIFQISGKNINGKGETGDAEE